MQNRIGRAIRIFILMLTLAAPSYGQTRPASSDISPVKQVQLGREYLGRYQYNDAVIWLESALKNPKSDTEVLRDAYLYLILVYMLKADDLAPMYGPKPDSLTGDLCLDRARHLTEACLRTYELRHTQPVTTPEAPTPMVRLFEEVRQSQLGSLHVTETIPPDAEVSLNEAVLQPLLGQPDVRGDVDIPMGQAVVEIQPAGFQPMTDQVVILPGRVITRSYRLKRKHGTLWYASRVVGGMLVSGVAGSYLLRDAGTPSLPDLPEPPPPPNK